jgi:hypothetical protein
VATLTRKAVAPGQGGKSPVQTGGSIQARQNVYTFDFDSAYAVGGEDISGIWDDFREVFGIWVQASEATIADNRMFAVDLANKKLIMLTAINTESGAVDQSAVTGVRLLAFGI